MSKELYEKGLSLLREHSEEICSRVMKSRKEDKGNLGYLEDIDIVREQKLARFLCHLLWRKKLEIDEKTDMEGMCDEMCYDCHYKRYNFHPQRAPDHWAWETPEGWYCQEECECK